MENRGWALEDRLTDEWGQRYPNLHVYYKAKFDLSYYHVFIGPERRVAREMLYGVGKGDKTPYQPTNMDIFDILNKVDPGGRSSKACSWWKSLDPPYDDWNNSEVLMKMFDSVDQHKSKKEFDPTVQFIGQKLVRVALALETWFESEKESASDKVT